MLSFPALNERLLLILLGCCHSAGYPNLELKSNRKRSLIRISGPINSKELENDRVYKNANALLEEITEMIHAKDESKPRRTEAGLSQTSKYLLRI